MSIPRSQTQPSDTWDLEVLYPDLTSWQQACEAFYRETGSPPWSKLSQYQGRLGEAPEILKATLDTEFSLNRGLEKLYVYSHLRHDEDIAHEEHKAAHSRAMTLYHELRKESAWIEPELLLLSESTLKNYLTSPLLKDYAFYLEKILRLKKHTLSPQEEALIALAGKALSTPGRAFSALSDADFVFGTIESSSGEEREVTQSSYMLFLRNQDRTLREAAFRAMHGMYKKYENTLCELLGGCVEGHHFAARAHRYSSCLEASLYPKNVAPDVYRSLIQAVRGNLSLLHRYVELRKRLLSLSHLHPWDLYVPVTKDVDLRIDYHEAVDLIVESVRPLGVAYQDLLKKGLKEQRWVDRYENKSKRSGAYSSGCFDSYPYILMNYKGMLRDVMTLAHEAGHSMHSLLSRSHQPYHYSDYPIFLAEVASTFNEELLSRLLMERFTSKQERIFLLHERIEDIRATLFRQAMFAEFELMIHEMVERKEPLTPGCLNKAYLKLNQDYFGEALTIDKQIEVEWTRIPHFYYNFYVYQYATGISAALALCDRVSEGGDKERDDYLSFLKGGSSRYPLDLLQQAGVDMRSPTPVNQALSKFGALVEELETLLDEERAVVS